MAIEQPNRERNPNLRIVTARTSRNNHLRREQLVQPFFHHRFAVTARYAHEGDVESLSVALGKALQGLPGGTNTQEIGIAEQLSGTRWHFFYHKTAHTATVKFGYIVVSVVSVRPQSEEQCLFWKTERATIGEHKADVRLGIA